MENLKLINTFSGGLDTDTDWNDVSPNDFIDALNIRSGFEGQDNVVSNIEGNRAVVSTYDFGIGNNVFIGHVENKTQNYSILFVSDNVGDDKIILYSPNKGFLTSNGTTLGVNEHIIEVARGDFGFSTNRPIHSAQIVNNRFLYFPDAIPTPFGISGNEPRKLNIEKAILKDKVLTYEMTFPLDSQATAYGSINTGQPFQIRTINAITGSLISTDIFSVPAGTYTRATLVTAVANILSTFGYTVDQSIPKKLTITALAAEQRLILVFPSSFQWLRLTPINHYPSFQNFHLALAVPQPRYAPSVDYTYTTASNQLAGQTPQYTIRYIFDDGGKSAWSAFGIIPSDPNIFSTQYPEKTIIDFYDEKLNSSDWLTLIRKVEIGFKLRNESSVKSLIVLDAADFGFQTDISITKDITQASTDSNHYVNGMLNYGVVVASDEPVSDATVQSLKHFDDVPQLSCAVAMIADENGIVRGFWGNNRKGYDNIVATNGSVEQDYTRLITDDDLAGSFNFNTELVRLKHYGTYKWGVVYYDSIGRKSAVQHCGEFTTGRNGEISKEVRFRIKHIPPTWAVTYHVVLSEEQKRSRYRQYHVTPSPIVDNEYIIYPTLVSPLTANDVKVMFDRTFSDVAEIVQSGQRMKVVRSDFLGTDESVYPDLKILGYRIDTAGATTAQPNSLIIECEPPPVSLVGSRLIADIYTPRQLETLSYYECGLSFPIVNGFHGGDIQSQAVSQDAIINMRGGDAVWTILRGNLNDPELLSSMLQVYLEFPDYYGNNGIMTNWGRANIVDATAKQTVYKNEICFSDVYNVNGAYNGLSSFASADKIQVDMSFGAIEKLLFMQSLWAICQLRAQSIYVGRDRILSINGAESIGRTNRILNIAQPTANAWGTFNPESVWQNDRFFGYFDLCNGVVVRTGADGQTNIAAIGNNNLFKGISEKNLQWLNNYRSLIKVKAGVETRYNMVYFSFQGILGNDNGSPITESAPAYGFKMYESTLRWVGRYDWQPDYFGSAANQFLTFSDRKIWVHDKNAIPCNFYGSQFDSTITFVVNQPQDAVKILNNLKVVADNMWFVKTVKTKPTYWFQNGQLSEIPDVRFENKEGHWAAEFLNDKLDDAQTFLNIVDTIERQNTALNRGRKVRDTAIAITLQLLDPSVKSKLRKVVTTAMLSQQTDA